MLDTGLRDCVAITDTTYPPLAGAGGGLVNSDIMFISCRWGVLCPPPSLRDTSASGRYAMMIFFIMTQSLRRYDEIFLVLLCSSTKLSLCN